MNKAYIGYSTYEEIRKKSSSGGVGSSIIKYLFDNNLIDFALSFKFDDTELKYIPVLVNCFDDYKIIGSIYQEMNMLVFWKTILMDKKYQNTHIAAFCLPCQTQILRNLGNKNNVSFFIIGLVCSAQQSFEATNFLMKCININRNNVKYIQYRGNGWPSGVQIYLNNDNVITIPNNNSIWSKIFHSKLFVQKKCFGCQNTLNCKSDITLADPWLKEYLDDENSGKTFFLVNTITGQDLINEMNKYKYIYFEKIDSELFIKAQKLTIDRKESYKKHPQIRKILLTIYGNFFYRNLIFSNLIFFKIHCQFNNYIERFMIKF